MFTLDFVEGNLVRPRLGDNLIDCRFCFYLVFHFRFTNKAALRFVNASRFVCWILFTGYQIAIEASLLYFELPLISRSLEF